MTANQPIKSQNKIIATAGWILYKAALDSPVMIQAITKTTEKISNKVEYVYLKYWRPSSINDVPMINE